MEYAGYDGGTTGQKHQFVDWKWSHTLRVCTIEEYREYIDIVKSDLGAQTNGGTPEVTIESLHASAGHLDPPGYIRFASSSYVNAGSKIDKRVDNLNFIENLYFGFGPIDLQTKL